MNAPYTRREFVHGGLGLVGLISTVPAFLSKTAWALAWPDHRHRSGGKPKQSAEPARPNAFGSPHERILVVLQLAGGNDGLNTIVPFRDDLYYKARRRIAVPAKDVLRLSDDLGLNPAAKGLKQLYDDGLLAAVHGVGYPNPNRSHFVSTDIWETADPEEKTYTGWVGRFFDNCCKGAEPVDPKLGIALTREAPLAMIGSRFSPVSFLSPDQLQWQPSHTNKGAREAFAALNGSPGGEAGVAQPVTTLDFLRREAFDAQMNVDQIRQAAGKGGAGPRAGLGAHLTMVANMIAAGLPTRVYYVSLTGFDTHSAQEGRHPALLTQLGEALTSFFKALKATGNDGRVVLMTFSEFGRRVEENASGGTDHGAAAPMFLAGAPVKAGLHGKPPSLKQLDAGDLKHTTDFRSVYATILDKWLGVDTDRLIPGNFPRLDLLRV